MCAILKLTVAEAKFSEVVDRARQGEEIIVTRRCRPVAHIVGYEPSVSNCPLRFFEGRIRIAADFDAWPE